jgi:hypothetical protein
MQELKLIESIDDLTPDIYNANAGSERGLAMLEDSITKLGAGRSILVDRYGRIIAGNKTTEVAADRELDVEVIRTDGSKLVVVQRTDLDLDDAEDGRARELAYADNRTSEVSLNWIPEQVIIDLERNVDLSLSFTPIELETYFGITPEYVDADKGATPNPRILPIDVIYTLQMADCTCCLAVQAGLKYGINSAHYRLCPYVGELSGRHEVTFIDNEYREYDHDIHLQAVKDIRPKYATVRDIMSRDQCETDDIEYYEFAQIMGWAEELKEYADNVIVIPKIDVLDQIPDEYILGYSVPTSHGGTPLPLELFRGRRVHLLGGSWKEQLRHMSQLGDDIVSLDNNHVRLMASRFGQYYTHDNDTQSLEALGLRHLNNPLYASLAISFGEMSSQVNALYASADSL